MLLGAAKPFWSTSRSFRTRPASFLNDFNHYMPILSIWGAVLGVNVSHIDPLEVILIEKPKENQRFLKFKHFTFGSKFVPLRVAYGRL